MSETVTYILPDKLGGVFNYVGSLLAHRQLDQFSYHAVLTDNARESDDRSDGALPADSIKRLSYDLPRENIHAVIRRLYKVLPSEGGVLVMNDWLPLAMASIYDTQKMVVNITHADSDYYYGLATRHEPIIDCFVTYTPYLYSRLCELLPHRLDSIFLLPYGISIPEATRKPHPGPVRLLYVGRLNRGKGIFDLPEIDYNLRQRGMDITWTVQGIGPDGTELKAAWPNESVRWCGRQSYDRVLELYKSHDVLVMPSRSEGLPVALLEATACGLVPVVSDLATGMSDVVENGISGFRLAVGDTAAFADSIATLVNDRGRLEAMSQRAREICARKFNIAHLVGGYQELFARWRELKRPRPANFKLQFGSRLDQHWIPNAIVKLLRYDR